MTESQFALFTEYMLYVIKDLYLFNKGVRANKDPLTSYEKILTIKYISNILKIQPNSGNFIGVTV
jgi:hypothetical protein